MGELPLVPSRRRDHGAGDALRLAERTESISRIGLSAGIAVGAGRAQRQRVVVSDWSSRDGEPSGYAEVLPTVVVHDGDGVEGGRGGGIATKQPADCLLFGA